MFNLNKKAARNIIGYTMIFGSIAGATSRSLYYAKQLAHEKTAHLNSVIRSTNEIHDLYVENEMLRERAITAEVKLDRLTKDK